MDPTLADPAPPPDVCPLDSSSSAPPTVPVPEPTAGPSGTDQPLHHEALAPVPDYAAMGDAALVAYAVRTQVVQNAAHARRLRAFAEIHARCAADHQARRANATQPRFVLTPGE
ncbi:MAG: hypothetical protein ACTHOK_04900 [Nocardioidaceae bacterium]